MVGFVSWGRPNYLYSSSSVDPVELLEEALMPDIFVTLCCPFSDVGDVFLVVWWFSNWMSCILPLRMSACFQQGAPASY